MIVTDCKGKCKQYESVYKDSASVIYFINSKSKGYDQISELDDDLLIIRIVICFGLGNAFKKKKMHLRKKKFK